jgi:hypothetical protein
VNQTGPTLTLTTAATETIASATITAWNAPLIPFSIISMFITLASASLQQARWKDTWAFAIDLFVAHYCDLFARADGNPNTTTGMAAAQGIATGIAVSKSAGDVSVGYQALKSLEEWGAWNLTVHGQMLATLAKALGSAPMLLY